MQTELTKRELFALKAMQSLLTKYTLGNQEDQRIIATLSVQLADSLLKALKNEPA